MKPLRLAAMTATSALGHGLAAQRAALEQGRSGLSQTPFEHCDLPCWTGAVEGLDVPLTGTWAAWDCRNNRLSERALDQDGFRAAVAASAQRHGADRVGVFVGTSTSGMLSTEHAYRAIDPGTGRLPADYDYRTTHNPHAAAEFVRLQLGLQGPALAICTACSSSAKVFAAAYRALDAGWCDAAVVGGIDSLCLTTLYGFHSLQLIADDICRPADVHRKGISIGEAAGFALLERGARSGDLALLGYGESSDAYHMSAPDPDGRGAQLAMRDALERAGLHAADIGYVNLHGTATPANDASEDRAVMRVFGAQTPCSSTKGYTGHTLGAAGIVEAVIAALAVEHGFLPASITTREKDPAIEGNIVLQPQRATIRAALSNSFGFGGNNASLILGRAA
ncbi:beta-ketoacyl-[acyl-carrier-protein] synthase family protein [Fontimonas sp. SYSU GA230001]|uniref:beta-ketoacyl-[acyl-carrier-protein] synthase family protein n=1 Tax=Fontimonas sp. SYSU GA230001 TaxID=3142450 RepID=UPI0032B34794